ncbi:disease resistance protein RUN1 [Trifolium repens]|nr:disease resistance protein RUN1 [Trifolium repens]
MASTSNNSSSHRVCKYDVFLSFRGTDTRNNFIDHLYNHLIKKGIFVFKDDQTLQKGEFISSQLLQAIRDSRVSIVVFSQNYPQSTWCLDEMVAISDCRREFKQTVIPVFYDVDPSHVRKQIGIFKDDCNSQTKKFKYDLDKVNRWQEAMTELGNLVGFDVRDKPEFTEIGKIVQAVIKTLGHKFSGFADDLVGMQPHIEELEKLLKLTSEDDDFRVLGIWGMGGVGKTTHATVLLHSGIKVLLVLDNVDQLEQLQELAINPKLLCRGSWSRLWQYHDFHHVLMTETGANNVKAIVLDQKENFSKCMAEGFSNMRNLVLLILYHNNFSGNINFLSDNLRYLLWHGYPFTSLPSNFEPYYLVELNMPNCSIQRLWEGRKDLPYLKSMDVSNSKSGLHVFDCPKLKFTLLDNHEYFSDLLCKWLERLLKEPRHFRCGFDIIVPWNWENIDQPLTYLIPEWFHYQFSGRSVIRIVKSNVDDNWVGFSFCVVFEVNNRPANSGSSHGSSSSALPHPFYLSFESEYTEERFDMPLSLELVKIDAGAAKLSSYDNSLMFLNNEFEESDACHLRFDHVEENISSSGPKIQLPYNWLVTEEEEVENSQAKSKEIRLSNLGL